MFRKLAAAAMMAGLTACGDGNPFDDPITDPGEPGADTSTANAYFDDADGGFTADNIEYDAGADEVIINNIPFDDPDNRYELVSVDPFGNGFDTYSSMPAGGTGEVEYFAVFRRTTNSQVAAVGTDAYVDFGYAGAGAQRLSGTPSMPTEGIYLYTGDYAAVRTTLGSPNTIEYVAGEASLRVDIADFDVTGAVGGTIENRSTYTTAGALVGADTVIDYISLVDTGIDFTNQSIVLGDANAYDAGGAAAGTGSWDGVFTGPNGEQIAGIVFVSDGTVQEVGTLIADR